AVGVGEVADALAQPVREAFLFGRLADCGEESLQLVRGGERLRHLRLVDRQRAVALQLEADRVQAVERAVADRRAQQFAHLLLYAYGALVALQRAGRLGRRVVARLVGDQLVQIVVGLHERVDRAAQGLGVAGDI